MKMCVFIEKNYFLGYNIMNGDIYVQRIIN